MTYRERRLAKADRLRGWADRREQKSEAAYGRADEIASGIPAGQPILVGHHSEGRARRDQARIESGLRAGHEHAAKARGFRSRADNIEAAAEQAVYSDDPDAVERLAERLAALEAERERIKLYNASARRGEPDASLLDERQREALLSALRVAPYSCKRGQFPGYALTNLSGNIARNRKRLEELRGRTT